MTDKNLSQLPPVNAVLNSLAKYGINFQMYDEVRVEPTDQRYYLKQHISQSGTQAPWLYKHLFACHLCTGLNSNFSLCCFSPEWLKSFSCFPSFLDAIEFAKKGEFDAYVAVGGGSVIDTCKAANLYASSPTSDFLDYVNAPIGKGKPVTVPLKPHIAGKAAQVCVGSEGQEAKSQSLPWPFHLAFGLTFPLVAFSSKFAAYFTGFVISLSFLAELDSFYWEKQSRGLFLLTCWLWIRDTSKISQILYFWWHYYCVFLYSVLLYITYYLLLSPFFFLSSYNSWNWKWNHWCCHFWLQRTKSKNWWDFLSSIQDIFSPNVFFIFLPLKRNTACHCRCQFIWFNCHRQIWRA